MFLCPVESPCRLTQHFGERPEVYKQFHMNGHNGIDLTGPQPGVPVTVYAPFDGVVAHAGPDGGYGLSVRIHTEPNAEGKIREVVLGHHSQLYVKEGDRVNIGDPVGMMGMTGFATGIHVHVGLRYLDVHGNVFDYGNGFLGYVNFEPYLLPLYRSITNHITLPYG